MTATSPSVTDILTHMIATFLAPMFLTVTGGDLDQARAAAIATVSSCTARHPMDLLLIGQMIALGLATLGSVSLSMAEDIPISLILRLRGNAVSLHRASDHCRRALPEPKPAAAQHPKLSSLDPETEFPPSRTQPPAPPLTVPEPITPDFPESLDAMKAAMAQILAESGRRTGETTQTTPPATPDTALTPSERILRAAWSYAMPDAAPGAFDDLAGLRPSGHRAASLRAEALSTTASQLIDCTPPPPR